MITALGEILIDMDPEVRIELPDFGVLEVRKTKAKPIARNLRTNETVFIPGRRKTHFKPRKRVQEVLQVPLAELDYEILEGSADKMKRVPQKNKLQCDGDNEGRCLFSKDRLFSQP